MESESDTDISIAPQHPHQMDIKDLSLVTSPYILPRPPSPEPPDPELMKKLGLTTDELGEIVPKEEPKTEIKPEPELEPESECEEPPETHIPIVPYSTGISDDIIYDFNRINEVHKKSQGKKLNVVEKQCIKCLQYLIDQEDYPLDDYEETDVSVRSPSGNREKVLEQLKNFQYDLYQYRESTPAKAGIPVTTPRKSPYPKRPMSFNLDREPEATFVSTPHTSTRCPCCSEKTANQQCCSPYCSQKPNNYFFLTTQLRFPGFNSKEPKIRNETIKTRKSATTKYPVIDLRKTYVRFNPRNSHFCKKNSSSKPQKEFVHFNDPKTNPEFTVLFSNNPMHKVVSNVFEIKTNEELENDIFKTPPETILEKDEHLEDNEIEDNCDTLEEKDLYNNKERQLQFHNSLVNRLERYKKEQNLTGNEKNTSNITFVTSNEDITLNPYESYTSLPMTYEDNFVLSNVSSEQTIVNQSKYLDQAVVSKPLASHYVPLIEYQSVTFVENLALDASDSHRIGPQTSYVPLELQSNPVFDNSVLDQYIEADQCKSETPSRQRLVYQRDSSTVKKLNTNQQQLINESPSTQTSKSNETTDNYETPQYSFTSEVNQVKPLEKLKIESPLSLCSNCGSIHRNVTLKSSKKKISPENNSDQIYNAFSTSTLCIDSLSIELLATKQNKQLPTYNDHSSYNTDPIPKRLWSPNRGKLFRNYCPYRYDTSAEYSTKHPQIYKHQSVTSNPLTSTLSFSRGETKTSRRNDYSIYENKNSSSKYSPRYYASRLHDNSVSSRVCQSSNSSRTNKFNLFAPFMYSENAQKYKQIDNKLKKNYSTKRNVTRCCVMSSTPGRSELIGRKIYFEK